ncbi:MAG: rhodanese-like domain-containing protein [Candidatus Planktophila sp.]|jgi:phage shock protein E|tara:strand:- start:1765 stop:2145 length:381 start_codon:yes stop_codon:yes gene_type:complete
MKSKFAVFITLLLLSGCGSPSSTDLTATDFQGKTMENGVVILDVRTSGEFNSGHIKNAINIDVESMQFDSAVANLDKSATYAVYCQSGRRSAIAVGLLKDAGISSLFNLKNGIVDWNSKGLPSVIN